MNHSNLYDLLYALEYGTNIHISVVFLDNNGNYKTSLPEEKVIHSKPYCTFMKSTPSGYTKCFKCRNAALKKAISTLRPFGGNCFNGVYEYCHPVTEKNRVLAVIFIGNILSSPSSYEEKNFFIDTFEKNFDEEKCVLFAGLIENHIKLLLSEYEDGKGVTNPLVTNIINYIEESFHSDITVKEISEFFNYNEKYLGKLFKKHSGLSVKEYINTKRLRLAEQLLASTNLSVTEISAKSGFNNVTYFNRLFKKQYNLSPRDYRSIMKKSYK